MICQKSPGGGLGLGVCSPRPGGRGPLGLGEQTLLAWRRALLKAADQHDRKARKESTADK